VGVEVEYFRYYYEMKFIGLMRKGMTDGNSFGVCAMVELDNLLYGVVGYI
jgi:hypothetical protein